MPFPAKYISVSINCPAEDVYRYIANGENLPHWAAGLSDASLEKSGDDWIANSPMGRVRVRFAPPNPYGVADHDVTLPSGEVNTNPLRVLKNDEGCDVVFTLFKRPQMSDADFQHDFSLIQQDLQTLKEILEK